MIRKHTPRMDRISLEGNIKKGRHQQATVHIGIKYKTKKTHATGKPQQAEHHLYNMKGNLRIPKPDNRPIYSMKGNLGVPKPAARPHKAVAETTHPHQPDILSQIWPTKPANHPAVPKRITAARMTTAAARDSAGAIRTEGTPVYCKDRQTQNRNVYNHVQHPLL